MKYLKIITLLSTLMGIGVSVYYKLYLLTVFLVLLLFYFLHIFMKKESTIELIILIKEQF